MRDCNDGNCVEEILDHTAKIEKLLSEAGFDSSDPHVARALVTLYAQSMCFSGNTRIYAEGVAFSDIRATFASVGDFWGGKVGQA